MTSAIVLLTVPPVWFGIVLGAGSLAVGVAVQGDPERLATAVPAAIPYILLANHLLLGAWVLRRARATGIRDVLGPLGGWRTGLLAAPLLVALNQTVLLPAMRWATTNLGDYVPPGEMDDSLSGALLITGFTAVVLAPVVEELLYRGLAWRPLAERRGPLFALLVTSLAFGPLHWAQGFWPMVYTIVVGAVYGALRWRTGSVLAPMVVHAAFNAVELALL